MFAFALCPLRELITVAGRCGRLAREGREGFEGIGDLLFVSAYFAHFAS
jgi:hypothetical protein